MRLKESGSNRTQVKIAWHCTCFNIRRASRSVTEYYDSFLAPSGVRATQFTMLGAAALMGPASVTRLAERLALDRTTLTRNLRVLAEEGLVTISAGKDRRERVVQLTEAGQTAIDRATPLWHKAQSRLIENLGEQRWRRMIEDFADLSDLLEENSD